MARILSVWLPRWPITVWRRRCGVSADTAAALVLAERGVRKLHAVNEAAAAMSLRVGQKAADASALVPGLILDDADPAEDEAALERLVDWCCRFSPAVAKDAPDGLFLDIDGVAHLWGGEAELMDDFLERLQSQGIVAKAAIADTAGAAWALARFGEESPIVDGPPRTALANLPVAALRLDDQDAAQFVRLGASRIEHLLALPRAGLARRFGRMALIRLDQALGDYPEALAYRRPPTPWFERLHLVEPISSPEDIERVAGDLSRAICARLEGAERAARRFEFAFHRVDGAVHRIELGVSRAGRDPRLLTRLIRPKLDVVDPGFGIEAATIAARQVERLSPAQIALAETEAEKGRAAVAGLIDSLSNRLGPHRVWRAKAHQSHVPERAVARVRAGEDLERFPEKWTPVLRQETRPRKDSRASSDPSGSNDALGEGWDPELPRPVRLFKRPEAIEVMALLPDDPPIQFRWRGRLHRVRLAEGPERIGDEWWRRAIETVSTDQVRDYYRVEDEEGGRFWVFRSGLAGAKWWLHGVFG